MIIHLKNSTHYKQIEPNNYRAHYLIFLNNIF